MVSSEAAPSWKEAVQGERCLPLEGEGLTQARVALSILGRSHIRDVEIAIPFAELVLDAATSAVDAKRGTMRMTNALMDARRSAAVRRAYDRGAEVANNVKHIDSMREAYRAMGHVAVFSVQAPSKLMRLGARAPGYHIFNYLDGQQDVPRLVRDAGYRLTILSIMSTVIMKKAIGYNMVIPDLASSPDDYFARIYQGYDFEDGRHVPGLAEQAGFSETFSYTLNNLLRQEFGDHVPSARALLDSILSMRTTEKAYVPAPEVDENRTEALKLLQSTTLHEAYLHQLALYLQSPRLYDPAAGRRLFGDMPAERVRLPADALVQRQRRDADRLAAVYHDQHPIDYDQVIERGRALEGMVLGSTGRTESNPIFPFDILWCRSGNKDDSLRGIAYSVVSANSMTVLVKDTTGHRSIWLKYATALAMIDMGGLAVLARDIHEESTLRASRLRLLDVLQGVRAASIG